MYRLTLTCEERQAFDWVGHRYTAGDIADLLKDCMPEDAEWCEVGSITFSIPEHVAWLMLELAEQEDSRWPCFGDTLASKLNDLLDRIV